MAELGKPPLARSKVLEMYFMEHRAKLIDLAAYLDRLDRADADGSENDFRDRAFREAIKILSDGEPHRAKRILQLLSDHSTEIPQSAHGLKGAAGAPPAYQTRTGQA